MIRLPWKWRRQKRQQEAHVELAKVEARQARVASEVLALEQKVNVIRRSR